MTLLQLPLDWMPIRKSISKSQYQSADYVPQDLFELAEEEERQEEERTIWEGTRLERAERQIELATRGYYLDLRRKNKLTHAQAALAADPEGRYYKMPIAKKTSKSGTRVSKAAYPKKGTVTKTTTTKTDINKLVKQATERALAKNIETQHSCAIITMHGAMEYRTSGFDLSSLNLSSKLTFSAENVMCFNLSSMLQVRGSTTSGNAYGWRQGNKVNVESLSVNIVGTVRSPHVDCKYHLWVCRKRDGLTTPFHIPAMQKYNELSLWKARNSGPFGSDGLNGNFHSANKRNTESWSWPEGMQDSKILTQVPDEDGVRMLQMGFYKKFGTGTGSGVVWEFTTDVPTATPTLKDGDYCLFLFREGAPEATPPKDEINVFIDIAFKDA